jgi:threonine dehydratase
MTLLLDFQHVLGAAKRIAPYVHRTPVFRSATLDRMTGAELYFKAESMQRTGSFKARGGCNAVFSLAEAEAARGVATHSSGNHAQAVAYAAGLRGIPATIVWAGDHPLDRERELETVLAETGAVFIHPSNDPRVIAGQGTAALELLDEVGTLDVVMTPVGGGGLLSGTALAVTGRGQGAVTMGAEPQTVDDAYRSLRDGCIYPPTNGETVADGLRTFLGDVNFPIIQTHVSDIVTVTEQGIVAAMRLVWERVKIIIEPSSAVPVAALFEHPETFAGGRVGVILSGGNVSLDALPW